MRKIWNSMFYGDSKTKSYLWSMVITFVAAMLCIAASFLTKSFPTLVMGFLMLCVEVAIYFSVSFRDVVEEGERQALKKKAKKQLPQELQETSPTIQKKDEEALVEELGMEAFEKQKKASDLKKYDAKSVKKLMIKYKVKKEHKKIMVDLSQTFRIHQCPAYIWKDKRECNLLLLEENPRIVRIPFERIHGIGYEKMVEAKPATDYEAFTHSCMVTKLFSEFLPQYKEGSYQGKAGFYKNLYTIAPDIQITSSSARNLFDALEVDFDISDAVTNSKNYSVYYKKAYKINILWKDGVITTSEYKERIKELLNLVATEKVSKQTFEELLEQLVKSKLITTEYASYYREIR